MEKKSTMVIVPYTNKLKITNLDQLPRGKGIRYLEVVQGEGEEYIAKQWRTKAVQGMILIDTEPWRFSKEEWEWRAGEMSSKELSDAYDRCMKVPNCSQTHILKKEIERRVQSVRKRGKGTNND